MGFIRFVLGRSLGRIVGDHDPITTGAREDL